MWQYKNNIILVSENIISFPRNITSHFTGKEKIITLVSIIIMLSFANIINTSALNYQGNAEIKFTFNPTLSINISNSDLVIDNLTPGTAEDSNIISVSVATNTAYGYTLSAAMNGNNDDLTHTNGTNIFSNIATNANLTNLTTDNTWGYSYKDNTAQTPTWSNYNGLSNSNGAILLDTNTNNVETGIDSVDFKIAAKAGGTQASGTYTGTINFTAVTKLKPKEISDLEYLQDFAELDETDLADVKSSMSTHSVFTLKDKRDEQEYAIAKLADGKIWMTKNLNLAGGTEITSELSDVSEGYVLPTANGFLEGNRLPESSQTGFSDSTRAYIYNTGNNADDCANPGCYSYYSWHAATAGSGVNITTNNTDAPYSICPKGWKLPDTRHEAGDNSSDFMDLMVALGGSIDISKYDNSVNPINIEIYKKLTSPTLNFLLTGYYGNGGGVFRGGNSYGEYWASTRSSFVSAYSLAIYGGSTVDAAESFFINYGYAVRCLAR